MTLSIDDLIATAQPRTLTVRVCARGDLVDRHAALVAELDAVMGDSKSIGGSPDIKRLAAEIVEVEAEQEAHTAALVMRSVSRRRWVDLLAEHPPRPADKERGLDHNPVTFPVAAVQACCDGMSPEQAEQLSGNADPEKGLHPAEWNKLYMAAQALNILETPHPKLPAALSIARESGDS